MNMAVCMTQGGYVVMDMGRFTSGVDNHCDGYGGYVVMDGWMNMAVCMLFNMTQGGYVVMGMGML